MFNNILNLASKAFKTLFKNGGYKPEDLKNVREYRKLIGATAQMISNEIPHEVPQEMKYYLKKDAFIFSGMRTHAQLAEANSLLKNDKGEIRPYYEFERDILKLNQKYNRNYLEAEYLFAKSSAQSAANWVNYSDDTSRYLLQYRTAGDERVRESHAALNRTTLPKNSAFWDSYYPPNGWRCRCTVVEVRAAKYSATDEAKAISEGEKATTQIGKNDKNKLEMFRFNPGKEKRIFPKNTAYYPKNCDGGKVDLSRLIGHAYFVLNAENDKCKAGKVVKGLAENKWNNAQILNSERAKQFKEISDNVFQHHLVDVKKDDFAEIKNIATEFAKQKKRAEILPEIYKTEKSIRDTIFPNLKSKSSNPDLRIGAEYYDLKRPTAIKNILGNANKASKQGAIAIISDSKMEIKLTPKIMENRAKHIFKDESYTGRQVVFWSDGKLHFYNRTGGK